MTQIKATSPTWPLNALAVQGAERLPISNSGRILVQTGVVLIGGALVSAGLAWLHMRELMQSYGAICGSGPGVMAHCLACYASIGFLAAAAAAFILAHAKGNVALLRVRSNPSV